MAITRSAAANAAAEDAAEENFVFGGGTTAPVYQKPFSVASSCRFFKEYREYKRNVDLSNSGQTVQRPLLTLSQLLPEQVRWCLADLYFEDNGDEELVESDLQQGLAQHGECWTGSAIHPNQAVAEVERLLEMRSEPTAVARIDAARARMEEYFENPGVARIFREKRKYIEGSARVVTEALVRGLKPQEFKEDVVDALKVKGKWKENPNLVFNLIREQALIWRVVERRDEKRRIRGKSGSASKGGPSPSSPPQQRQRNSKLTCWMDVWRSRAQVYRVSYGPWLNGIRGVRGRCQEICSAHARPTAAFSRCAAGEGYFRCSRRCSANITCYYGCFCCDTGRCACW